MTLDGKTDARWLANLVEELARIAWSVLLSKQVFEVRVQA